MSIKKIKTGEATFVTEQSFNTAEDAYNNKDPLNEEQVTIKEVKIDKTLIKKEVKEDVTGQ